MFDVEGSVKGLASQVYECSRDENVEIDLWSD